MPGDTALETTVSPDCIKGQGNSPTKQKNLKSFERELVGCQQNTQVKKTDVPVAKAAVPCQYPPVLTPVLQTCSTSSCHRLYSFAWGSLWWQEPGMCSRSEVLQKEGMLVSTPAPLPLRQDDPEAWHILSRLLSSQQDCAPVAHGGFSWDNVPFPGCPPFSVSFPYCPTRGGGHLTNKFSAL